MSQLSVRCFYTTATIPHIGNWGQITQVLISNGSEYNLISRDAVNRLRFSPYFTPPLKKILENGTSVSYNQMVRFKVFLGGTGVANEITAYVRDAVHHDLPIFTLGIAGQLKFQIDPHLVTDKIYVAEDITGLRRKRYKLELCPAGQRAEMVILNERDGRFHATMNKADQDKTREVERARRLAAEERRYRKRQYRQANILRHEGEIYIKSEDQDDDFSSIGVLS